MNEPNNTASAHKEESQLVTFYLGDEEFGFDIMSVQEIIRQPKLSRIPMVPAHIEGIANLRGLVLPIIDTRTRFGMPRAEDTDRTRVLVVDVDGNKTGLRVDRVSQVTRVQQREMEPPPAVVRAGMNSDYLESVVKLDEGKRIVMALNPRAICKLALEELQKQSQQTKTETTKPAEAAAGVGGDQSVSQLVTFKLGREEFAFPMDRVREILRVERPNEVPGSPRHLLGMLTIRGRILPVIDLRVILGLTSLEEEVVAAAAGHRARFEAWLKSVGDAAQAGNFKLDSSGAEALRKWISESNTSSQVLMGVLGKMRSANGKVLRGVQQAQNLAGAGVDKLRDYIQPEVAAPGQEVLALLDQFQTSVKENIREDQRLIVVQTNSSLLALLVDKVREVLNMPKAQIDPPPQTISEGRNLELSGIAKLESGKRLIMLLDVNGLIKDQELESLGATTADTGGNGGVKSSADRAADGATLGEEQFVTFRLADGDYGVPISKVQEIDRSSRMTRVPRTAAYMDGITNLRGEVVPVINARKRFQLPAEEADERTRVIIMEVGGLKTGLLVDSVREVLSLARKDIAPAPPSLTTSIDRQYISGIGKVDGDKRMIVLLDVEKILEK